MLLPSLIQVTESISGSVVPLAMFPLLGVNSLITLYVVLWRHVWYVSYSRFQLSQLNSSQLLRDGGDIVKDFSCWIGLSFSHRRSQLLNWIEFQSLVISVVKLDWISVTGEGWGMAVVQMAESLPGPPGLHYQLPQTKVSFPFAFCLCLCLCLCHHDHKQKWVSHFIFLFFKP